jgi:pre-mRNA-splicing factor CDC5/CEF1
MRILIKGGVWKNTEDEILKAAVMKYGKNQWARVASLLNRKSGKQCKARWYEWLDPSIKKTEWSKEEEEKLLHLAKLMPNQWRTIAPIVGRTAAQCMDQYERLLDQAQEGQESTDDPRRLRAGEIDPAPETKPARPDPIDMDEDEKEMLSEARARLANTKGKKAKRKARERQLEESRRLSSLQKRRELKAAGIESKLGGNNGGGKRKYIDYAREIPFQMVPPAGFYDVGDELEQAKKLKFDPLTHGMDIAKLDGRTQREEEMRQRAKDDKKLKALFKANAPLAVLTLSNANDPTALRKRSALSLPSPQVSDAELEDIVKVGQRALMPPPEGTISATQALIGNYSGAGYHPDSTPGTSLTQRTPLREDTIMQEARNQLLMREMTPFLAAQAEDMELPELAEGTGFEGVTPRASRLATPNVVLQRSQVPGTPLAGAGRSTASTTGSVTNSVRSNQTQTPLRDQFGLNSSTARPSALTKGLMSGTPLSRVGGSGLDDDTYSISETDSVTSTRLSEKQRLKHQRAILAAKLGNLPEPEYTYEVVIPEVETEDDLDEKSRQSEDSAEVQLRLKQARELEEQRELMRRSQVVQRQLPRPSSVNYNLAKSLYEEGLSTPSEMMNASSLVGQEMVQLLAYDDYKYVNPSEKRRTRPQPVELDEIEDHYLHLAKKAIVAELASAPPPPFDSSEFGAKAEEISRQALFVPSASGGGKYVNASEASKQDVSPFPSPSLPASLPASLWTHRTQLLTALTNQHAALKVKIQKVVPPSPTSCYPLTAALGH